MRMIKRKSPQETAHKNHPSILGYVNDRPMSTYPLQASRFGWSEDIQNQLTNSALLIRKYQRRLRLIKM